MRKFTNLTTNLELGNYDGRLLEILQQCADDNEDNGYSAWEGEGPNGYPIPETCIHLVRK